MRASTAQPIASTTPLHAPSLAEHFWSLARAMDHEDADDATSVIRHVLAILDAMDAGAVGSELTAQTVSFLTLLHQSEARGDLLYASPEQARGERMDERSLVFSVGVLIFEKLTGRHPFGADGNPQRLARIRKAEMASGVAYFQTINGPLRQILLKCMGPFPDERYGSMAELRSALESFVRGEMAQRTQRMLPALPYGDENEARQPNAPSPVALSVAAQREAGRRPDSVIASTGMAPSSSPPNEAMNPWPMRLAWMGAGALASGVLAFALNHASADGAKASPPSLGSSEVDSSAEEAVAAAPAQIAAPAAVLGDSGGAAGEEKAPVAEPALVAPTQVTTGPFDPTLGGQAALEAALPCFAEEKRTTGLGLGVSLRYGKEGSSQRVFFGGSGLTREERNCLSQALVGLRAGGAPDKAVSVSYDLWIHKDSGRVKARVAPER